MACIALQVLMHLKEDLEEGISNKKISLDEPTSPNLNDSNTDF